MPWDRAPLLPFEAAVYSFMRERVDAGFWVPGAPLIQKKFGCSQTAARGALLGLVAKGWLGEAGDNLQVLYFNDKPENID